MMGNNPVSFTFCRDLVREYEPDLFLLSMFVKPDRREALWALFAFQHEIAKTRAVVSETQLGFIRLQWWRDEIARIYTHGSSAGHEILKPLSEVILAYDLPQKLFEDLLYAREFDLEDVLPSDIEGTLNYADFTMFPLFQLALMITGDDLQSDPVHVVAVNYGLVSLLRRVASHTLQGRCYLPENLVDADKLYRGEYEDMQNTISRLLEYFAEGVKAESHFLKAVQRLVEIYVGQIRHLKCDVFHERLKVPPTFKVLRVILAVYLS